MSCQVNQQAIDDLKEFVKDRFDGTDERLDKINGKLNRHDSELAVLNSQKLNSRMVNMETNWNKAIGSMSTIKWLVGLGMFAQIVMFVIRELKL